MGLPLFDVAKAQAREEQVRARDASPQTSEGSPRAVGAGANTGAGLTRPKTEAELEADRLFEEEMEEQYARMEGGA